MNELATVVLLRDIAEYNLWAGDIGTIVYVYHNAAAYEVEFVTGEGETVAVLTLLPEDIRPMGEREILHVRELAIA